MNFSEKFYRPPTSAASFSVTRRQNQPTASQPASQSVSQSDILTDWLLVIGARRRLVDAIRYLSLVLQFGYDFLSTGAAALEFTADCCWLLL